jgi:hypothetical protein
MRRRNKREENKKEEYNEKNDDGMIYGFGVSKTNKKS